MYILFIFVMAKAKSGYMCEIQIFCFFTRVPIMQELQNVAGSLSKMFCSFAYFLAVNSIVLFTFVFYCFVQFFIVQHFGIFL